MWLEHVEALLGAHVISWSPVGGGCIAHASSVRVSGRRVFVKRGRDSVAAALASERDGLTALSGHISEATRLIGVPQVLGFGEHEGEALLILEWIEAGSWDDSSWKALGRGLAMMHQAPVGPVAGKTPTQGTYGWHIDNHIGSSPQGNEPHGNWVEFFADRRLVAQRNMAAGQSLWQSHWTPLLDRLLMRIPDLLPARPNPSLAHGDLWSGNTMVSAEGVPWLIDPAVYVAEREVDLAMSRLFGGFPDTFYRAYEEVWALEQGWQDRFQIYNLYHLLNHLNLFGTTYSRSVESVLRRFGS